MHDPTNGWFHGVECFDFRKRLSGEEFDKVVSDGRLYIFNKGKSDKEILHIQKVQQGGKDDGNEIALVPSSGVATINDNLGVYENYNE